MSSPPPWFDPFFQARLADAVMFGLTVGGAVLGAALAGLITMALLS